MNRNISMNAPSQMRKSSSIIMRYAAGGEGEVCTCKREAHEKQSTVEEHLQRAQ
jgi:hypothetical protein